MKVELEFDRLSEELPGEDTLVLGLWRGRYVLCSRHGEGDKLTWYDAHNDLHEGLCEDGGPEFWANLPDLHELVADELHEGDVSPCEEAGGQCDYAEGVFEECVHCGWAAPDRE